MGGKRGNSYSVPAEAGTVYIKLSVTYAGGEYDLVPTVTVTKIENVDYKVTLTDTTGGKPAGITVNLGTYDQSGPEGIRFVKEIHQKEVLTEDVFSDSVYLYSKKDDSFCRGAGNRRRDARYM